jgi:fluoroquinolone transport system permease protein
LRFVLPWLDGYLSAEGILPSETLDGTLADTFPMLVAYFALFAGALLPGAVFGFLLLEEKETETLTALRVTPVPMNRYLIYRVGLPALLAWPTIVALFFILGQALLPWWQIVVLAAGGALTTPIATLFYATFAENKVEGFAMTKFTGAAGWTILFGWFVGEPGQWLFGLFPPFLISKAYWMALEGRGVWWVVWGVGIALQLGVIGWLIGRFRRSVESS